MHTLFQEIPREIIVAVSANGVIGLHGKLPWHLPDELRHFRQLTMGHTLVMGRKTFESIGKPLAGRAVIVLSQQSHFTFSTEYHDYSYYSVRSPAMIEKILPAIPENYRAKICIIGGAQLFREALLWANTLHYTHIHAEVQGDVFMPKITWQEWECITSEKHSADARHAHAFTMATYKRQTPKSKFF
jgi:dihydrofolate reductase